MGRGYLYNYKYVFESLKVFYDLEFWDIISKEFGVVVVVFVG